MEEPWRRLYRTATCSSTQRNAALLHNKVPEDSLDFHLSSIYDHHKNIFWIKNQVLYQRNTVREDKTAEPNVGKVNTLKSICEEHIRVWVDPQRRSIYSQRW